MEMDKKSEASNEIVSVAPQSKIQWGSFGPDMDVEEQARVSNEFLQGTESWDLMFSEGWGLICKDLAMWGSFWNIPDLVGIF